METEIIIKTDLQLGSVQDNFDEIKTLVTSEMKRYKGLVFADADIRDAKATRAYLNRLRTQIEERRKAIKKQWNEPYVLFENKAKEIVAIIDAPIQEIDGQVKDYEERQREEKREAIREMQDEMLAKLDSPVEAYIRQCEWIHDQRWENASVSMGTVEKAYGEKVAFVLQAFKTLDDGGKFASHVMAKFQETGDLLRCIDYKKNLEKQDEEYRARKASEEQARRDAAAQRETTPAEKETKPEPISEPEPETTPDEPRIEEPAPQEPKKPANLFSRTFRVEDATYKQFADLVSFMQSNGFKFHLIKE